MSFFGINTNFNYSNFGDYYFSPKKEDDLPKQINNLKISQPLRDQLLNWSMDRRRQRFIQAVLPALSTCNETSFEVVPGSPWLSLLISSLYLKGENGNPIVAGKLWREQVSQLDPEQLVKLLEYLFLNPQHLPVVHFGEAKELLIRPYGGSFHTFAEMAKALMSAEGEENFHLQLDSLSQSISQIYACSPDPSRLDPFPEELLASLAKRITAIYGRTAVELNQSSLTGYKFMNKNESIKDFCREELMTNLFRNSGQFLSILPKPVGVFSLQQVPQEIKEWLPESVLGENTLVYMQETSVNYYHYLHGIKDENKWVDGRYRFLFDSGKQIAKGHLPPFADLYHSQVHQRRYQPLANLIPNIIRGAGKMEKPVSGVQYPNAGETGIRDAGDGDLLSELIKDPSKESMDLFKMKEGKMTYLLLSALAKLSLVDSLLMVLRLEKKGLLNWEDESVIASTASALKQGQKWILEGFTGADAAVCGRVVDEMPIDWRKQAMQMIFWLQTDEKGYPFYVQKGSLPMGLYDNEMKWDVDITHAMNFFPNEGFKMDGEKNVGCYNGPLGWVEHEKGWYTLFPLALGLYYSQHAKINSPLERESCQVIRNFKKRSVEERNRAATTKKLKF